jgi:hypothetical protein
LQFFGLDPAKLRIFKEAVPKTEVLEQPQYNIGKFGILKQFKITDN